MKKDQMGIATGGERRLRKAVEVEVRREYEAEFSAASEHWQKVAIEEKIEREIKGRIKKLASPQSLWFETSALTHPLLAGAQISY